MKNYHSDFQLALFSSHEDKRGRENQMKGNILMFKNGYFKMLLTYFSSRRPVKKKHIVKDYFYNIVKFCA